MLLLIIDVAAVVHDHNLVRGHKTDSTRSEVEGCFRKK